MFININNFQFNNISWSTLYLGNVPLIKIARVTNKIIFKNKYLNYVWFVCIIPVIALVFVYKVYILPL